jgi:phosphatidylglycerophosphate synthase
MLDTRLVAWIKPCIDALARSLARRGLQANHLTLAGFALGLASSGLIANTCYLTGLCLLLLSRLLDALDGAVARLTQPTDLGGFLDITLDFIFYASVPLAFAFADPVRNALPAAVLLFAFMGTSNSFLAYASIAAKRQLAPSQRKAIAYLGGLTEGAETLVCFALMCLLPDHFKILAYGFVAMCFVTIVTRLYAGWRDFN